MEGNDQSVVRSLTEHVGEGVLDTDVMVATGQTIYFISVRDAFSVRVLCFLHMMSYVFLPFLHYLDVISFFSSRMLRFVVLIFML